MAGGVDPRSSSGQPDCAATHHTRGSARGSSREGDDDADHLERALRTLHDRYGLGRRLPGRARVHLRAPAGLAPTAAAGILAQYETTAAELNWVSAVYLLSSTVCVPLMSRLGDLYGHRRLLVVAAVLVGALAIGGSLGLLLAGLTRQHLSLPATLWIPAVLTILAVPARCSEPCSRRSWQPCWYRCPGWPSRSRRRPAT
jgi:hypothetical protein